MPPHSIKRTFSVRVALIIGAAPLAATLLSGCSKTAAESQVEKPRVNVVLFLIDTLRADHMSLYGHDRQTTPFLDQLGKNSVVFDRAQAPAPWTLPSVPSIHTSTFPCEHGVTRDKQAIRPEIPTMAERFKRMDYHTISLYVNNWAGPITNMNRGFDVCRKPDAKFFVDGPQVSRQLRTRPDKPFFFYIHNIEPHNPHNALPQLISRFGSVSPQTRGTIGRLVRRNYNSQLKWDWDHGQALGTSDKTAAIDAVLAQLHPLLTQHKLLYDAVVLEADMRVASVVKSLKADGLWKNTLFIVLADHGDEFEDHGHYLHSQSVYQELTHVPLLVHFPGSEYAEKRVPRVVSLLDVLPTVFDYLGRPDLIGGARGRSLMPLIRGEEGDPPEPFIITTVRINRKKFYPPWGATRGNINVALMTPEGRWKAIWNADSDTVELYDLASDPHELNNVCAEQAERAGAMAAYARHYYDRCIEGSLDVPENEMSADDVENLRDLGYLAGGDVDDESAIVPTTSPAPVAAPRDNVPCPAPPRQN